ncbi:MAG: AAA family ATPase [Candidatus Sedimenticola sp. (ex Thyasira tokunagai)]
MELTLAKNPLYDEEQSLCVDKIVALIGENGSGKSTILHSVFNSRVTETEDKNGRLICFTSGQNESFSSIFSKRIDSIRKDGTNSDIDFGCLYFTKHDVRSLVFLSSTFVPQGRVRSFLVDGDYIIAKDGLDQTSVFSIPLKIPRDYLQRVKADAEAEEKDFNHPSIRKRPFNQRLEIFVDRATTLGDFDEIIEGEKGIRERRIIVTSVDYFNCFDGAKDDAVKFLIEGSYNGYFLDASSTQLKFDDDLEFRELSDGEYQMLFLYSLVDLFDSDEALFLLDEADSHLHYTNIQKLWDTLKEIKGRSISTTHLLDSISSAGIKNIHAISAGKISKEDKYSELTKRLNQLGYMQKTQFKVCSLIENIVLMDYPDDWVIFRKLAERKMGAALDELDDIQVIGKSSGWNHHNEEFGRSKVSWVNAFAERSCEWELATKNVFLICDRDNLPIPSIGKITGNVDDGVSVQGEDPQPAQWSNNGSPQAHLLSWKRREIENYLLSYTAIHGKGLLDEVNGQLGPNFKLSAETLLDDDQVRALDVKAIISPIIKPQDVLCLEALQTYIDLIPPEEISEDIENMYYFIVGKLN